VLDDDYVEPNDEGNIEEQLLKKRHFAELKGILQDSFPRGIRDLIRKIVLILHHLHPHRAAVW
jgi:hypothetical protein